MSSRGIGGGGGFRPPVRPIGGGGGGFRPPVRPIGGGGTSSGVGARSLPVRAAMPVRPMGVVSGRGIVRSAAPVGGGVGGKKSGGGAGGKIVMWLLILACCGGMAALAVTAAKAKTKHDRQGKLLGVGLLAVLVLCALSAAMGGSSSATTMLLVTAL
jgi:hypothetical protein